MRAISSSKNSLTPLDFISVGTERAERIREDRRQLADQGEIERIGIETRVM